jgi:hypothetical protein
MDPIDYNHMPSPSAPPATTVYDSPFTTLACIVCRSYGSTPMMAFPCGCTHPIHQSCVLTWRTSNDTCPTCKQIWINVLPAQPEIVYRPQQTIVRRQDAHNDELTIYQRRCCACYCIMLIVIVFGCAIALLFFVEPASNRK